MDKSNNFIELIGVNVNNLKNIDVKFPLYQITTVTGVSGSGKSSLVFDGLYAEAYRRYLESLSSFARQYIQSIPKPNIKQVNNLPAAVAVMQSRSRANSRSTVGTMTEANDHLRDLFTNIATLYCPKCKIEVIQYTKQSITQTLLDEHSNTNIMVISSLSSFTSIKGLDLKSYLISQGFKRILSEDLEIKPLESADSKSIKKQYLIIDRLKLNKENSSRLYDSMQLASKLDKNRISIFVENNAILHFPLQVECRKCHEKFPNLSTYFFSFNHPKGACDDCQGFGLASIIDYNKVIPDHSKSLKDFGVALWNFGEKDKYYKWAINLAKIKGISSDLPFEQYSNEQMKWLKEGDKKFDGIQGYMAWLESKKYKMHYRIFAARFKSYITCPTCLGNRLKAPASNYFLNKLNFVQVQKLSLIDLQNWLNELENNINFNNDKLLRENIETLKSKVNYLIKVGLKYLSLDRSTRTLSGGEFQRMNMARCLGNNLTDTLYCLDEPTTGLHVRDTHKLFEAIRGLKDNGNTVVVVEHDNSVIKNSDHLIHIGPGAGHLGGNNVFSGAPEDNIDQPTFKNYSSTILSSDNYLELFDVNIHNLKNVDCKLPLGCIVGICGVSGSGKSSLISRTLYPMLDSYFNNKNANLRMNHKGLEAYNNVALLNQGNIGRSSRSNIATYLGIYDEIRKLFAEAEHAKSHKLTPGSFSFNTPGGRCENCKGLGFVLEDLSFLGEVESICPICHGKKFQNKILEVKLNGLNIEQTLNLTVEQAATHFENFPKISKKLGVVCRTGLGYVTLGQSTSSFSGGEAQRLKLLSFLDEIQGNKPAILILDEPSNGLSDLDVVNFIDQIRTLHSMGHSIFIIEHHCGILQSCDWLVELGPDAGEEGGHIIYNGSPHEIAKSKHSILKSYLE